MSIQKLHYENLGGTLVRREGLLSWRCPLCKAEGQSPGVMRTCPECGSKEATLPGAQPAPSVPDGWKLVPIEPTQEMIDHVIDERLDALAAGKDHTFIDIYKAMLAAAPEAKP